MRFMQKLADDRYYIYIEGGREGEIGRTVNEGQFYPI